MTERGGGIVPGPVVEHMRAAAVFPGAANVANVDAGNFWVWALRAYMSMKSRTSLALASRKVSAGRFHLRSIVARIDAWSCTTLETWSRLA